MNVLVTGGSASGKSQYAEDVAMRLAQEGMMLAYVATMCADGEEGQARVLRHRQQRAGKGFTTIEQQRDLAQLQLGEVLGDAVCAGSKVVALVEDMGNLVANELFDVRGSLRDESAVIQTVVAGIFNVSTQCAHTVVVTNEVGADGLANTGALRSYVHCIGAATAQVAARFDAVIECVGGLPIAVKGELP